MISIDSLIAELKSSYPAYDKAGLIDEIAIYRWANAAIKKFGANVMTLQDGVVEVRNSQANLPENFYSLYVAYKCDRKGYSVESEEDKSVLQQSLSWVERVERSSTWNICDPCTTTETEKIITEKVYYGDTQATFYYNNPILLKLGKTMKRNACHSNCRNLVVKDCPYEISIYKTTLQANFTEGDIYFQYYGTPEDEEGRPMIPDTPKGEVETYIEYHIKRRIFENIIANNDDENARTLFQYYVQKEDSQLGLALTDAKFSTLTPNSFRRLKKANRKAMYKYECAFPNLDYGTR